MDSVFEQLLSQLSGGAVDQIGKQVGVPPQQAQQVVGMALPLLIGALSRNTSSPDGAASLAGALKRDHDGSILGNLAQAVGKPETAQDGSAILGHVLGAQQPNVVNSVSRATKLDANQVGQILAILAPIILGALGKTQRSRHLDDQGLSALLQQERKTVATTSSGLTQLLDMDGDGDVSEEIVSLGANLLGGLLSGKK
jgi:hypothetical protein